ncbi:MAG: hypothetical protein ACYDA8_15310 [Deferrisomatales bacterium]
MPVKEAEVRVRADDTACPRCGHSHLLGAARPQGADHLWFAYCPACREVQERASIPGWFTEGLLPPPGRLH